MGYIVKKSRMSRLIANTNTNVYAKSIGVPKRDIPIVHNKLSAIHLSPVTNVLQSGMWKDRRCFILGGGPSLDIDFNVLKDELTIGINKSFKKYDTTINYSMDQTFYDYLTRYDKKHGADALLYEQWKTYSGIKVFVAQDDGVQFESDVFIVNRLAQRVISLNLTKGIYPGNNAGFGAIMLAAALGANPIYLLGYDMKVSGNKTHWHNGYPNQSVQFLSKRLKKYVSLISEWAPSYEATGFDIVNLTPGSALTCFKTDTLNNILEKEIVKPMHIDNTKGKPIIVSFYTQNTGYEIEVKKLIESLERLNLDYAIVPINNTGNWQKNVRYKPTLIKNMLKQYYPRPVLYVDCDATFTGPPVLFDKFHYDFALHKVHWADFGRPHKDDELLGGTVYAANNERVHTILDLWIKGCTSQPLSIWDQKILYSIIGDNFYNLPPEYCTIFDSMRSVANPIILHRQASRTLKHAVRGVTTDIKRKTKVK